MRRLGIAVSLALLGVAPRIEGQKIGQLDRGAVLLIDELHRLDDVHQLLMAGEVFEALPDINVVFVALLYAERYPMVGKRGHLLSIADVLDDDVEAHPVG